MYTVLSDSRENTTKKKERKKMQYRGKIALAFLPLWDKKGGEQEERVNCTDPSSGNNKNGILAKSE